MTVFKILAIGTSSLLGVVLAAAMPPEPPGPQDSPKEKKKEDHGPGGEMKKAYNLLRRLRVEGRSSGRPEERLKDWTERATKLYKDALKAAEKGDEHRSHEYAIAAHDLARAVDHARNAAMFEAEDDLPPPPGADGPEGEDGRTRRDLRHAYDRITDLKDDAKGDDIKFYLDASKDLYNAARRDAVAGRKERAGELARAAEALTHVPEHLARAEDPDDQPEPKEKKARKGEPDHKEKKAKKDDEHKEKKAKKDDEPREKRDRPDRDGEIPPPIE